MPDLLIELFSEEIPARMQARAAEDLKTKVTNGLVEAGLTYAHAAAFATPRRLTLALEGVLDHSPTTREDRKGPKVDAPEKAIEGFLRGAGVAREDLEERDEKKGRVFYAIIEKPGRPAAEIIAEVLEDTIRTFPWPKSMRWGAGSLRWVRPLHRILCILTNDAGEADVVPMEVDGIRAGDMTEGHRFMAPAPFSVTSFEDYAAKLKRANVVLDPEERAETIWNDATNAAFASGMEVVEDKGLLAEVAGLVEWPVVLMGEIGADFLDLPPEVLMTSMKEHQKFFSVRNPKTGRIERFITVANRETADNGKTILAGNQKVLTARLSDAKFFWENDLRVAVDEKMQPWLDQLENVTFHNKLGSQKARIDRIAALAREIAPVVGADPNLAETAARTVKADLSSEMVGEFPELQGLMGRYYSDAAGLPPELAAACEEHYSPLGPSDAVPAAPVSVAVALADKLDTLTGFWAIDEKPTGSKDPFALRRAALGVIRLVLENGIRVELLETFLLASVSTYSNAYAAEVRETVSRELADSFDSYRTIREAIAQTKRNSLTSNLYKALLRNADFNEETESKKLKEFVEAGVVFQVNSYQRHLNHEIGDLLAFFHDRLKVHLRSEGVRHDVIDACLAMPQADDLTLLVKRARALQAVLETEDGENLVQGFKRANNILTQAEEKDGVEYSFGADPKFAETDAERALFAALDAADAKIVPAMKDEDFPTAMAAMAGIRPEVDAFFEAVQVNTDNEILRRNRLNLLSRIRNVCLQVADLTRLDG
ncbi:glycyl-tRNA synthetase beta chain [Roseivivax halotolerans]|uniref:Glycine--tRNA ligase beta subunit n=1 Tax=Roseivivax halotolerans TaxID=93684 RepID=A0A1I5Z9A8_9RHOB|nr:glycine--tRNA ligase subunit beta [Roseivivax halotolerans]SFQ53043.1 glycyl-tRNA synthetase beta chain [Roseivivax halotolerans]